MTAVDRRHPKALKQGFHTFHAYSSLEMSMKLISLKEAKEQGLTRYFTGKSCKHGHIDERYTANSYCIVCSILGNMCWKVKNEKRRREINNKYYVQNKDIVLERRKDYYARNKNKIGARVGAYIKNKRIVDPIYHTKCRVRRLILKAIVDKGFTKRSSTADILGCDRDTFYHYIESQFIRGMNWENRSLWHIDHKIPLASAKTEEDIIRLNHYTNLQPLWAEDNLRKGSKQPSTEFDRI